MKNENKIFMQIRIRSIDTRCVAYISNSSHCQKNSTEKNATEIMLLSKCVPNIYGVALKRFHVKIVFDVHFVLCWAAVIVCIVVVTSIDTTPPPPPLQIECIQTIKCKLTAHICFELHNIFVTRQNFHILRPFVRPFSLSHILIR